MSNVAISLSFFNTNKSCLSAERWIFEEPIVYKSLSILALMLTPFFSIMLFSSIELLFFLNALHNDLAIG